MAEQADSQLDQRPDPSIDQRPARQRNQLNRVYARALFEMAEEQGALDEAADEMDQLADLLRHDASLRRLLTSRSLSTAERAESIERVFKGRVSDVLYRFLQVLNRKERIDQLAGVAQSMSDLVHEHRGLIEVDAFVPQRLDEHEADQLAQRLGQIMHKQVVLHQYVDPSLIGGLKIRVGDRLIDGSVATQLRRLRTNLERAGREQARQEGAEGPRGRGAE